MDVPKDPFNGFGLISFWKFRALWKLETQESMFRMAIKFLDS